jgi:DNA-binding NarL/FixJ family response regulator
MAGPLSAGSTAGPSAGSGGRPVRVGIVDDHPIVRDGISSLLGGQAGIEVVGTAGSLDEARELLGRVAIDVLLLDIRLGSESGFQLLGGNRMAGAGPDASDRPPDPAIVVLSAYDYPQYAEAALRLGAAGYVVKTAPVRELTDAIQRAAAGGLAFGVRPQVGVPRLSRREREVVGLVVEGRSNDEVGAGLGIGVTTVETHLKRIFERFGLRSRTELVARAIREGWLEIPMDR